MDQWYPINNEQCTNILYLLCVHNNKWWQTMPESADAQKSWWYFQNDSNKLIKMSHTQELLKYLQ